MSYFRHYVFIVNRKGQRTLNVAAVLVTMLALGTLWWLPRGGRESHHVETARNNSVDRDPTKRPSMTRPVVSDPTFLAAYSAPVSFASLDGPATLRLAREDVAERVDLAAVLSGTGSGLGWSGSYHFPSPESPSRGPTETNSAAVAQATVADEYEYVGPEPIPDKLPKISRLFQNTGGGPYESGLRRLYPPEWIARGRYTAGGKKYSELLRKIAVPEDKESYGEYYESGYWTGTEWRGHKDLPPGYWVYVDGVWYIFKNGPGSETRQPQVPGHPSAVDSPKLPSVVWHTLRDDFRDKDRTWRLSEVNIAEDRLPWTAAS